MELNETATNTVPKDFVTVVSVGTNNPPVPKTNGYVTVLTIGEDDEPPDEVVEEVLVYRLPGERLGFGLKFEGGTKAAEFVKRLFIQSCAPDSPASRVSSTWGQLMEGDEVLEIDCLPVKTMTRIDCVRCLKDSNVVIKLLVKHVNTKVPKLVEDLPQVVSAEKKRVPPPPPPVPPRKVPRKLLKEANKENSVQVSTPRQIPDGVPNGSKVTRFQSPRNSGRSTRDRRVSVDSTGPPDPEVYIDLFSQESACSLSESDDTGSSISTIIDRLSSFPTTTNSSFAGSLPSTPTSIKKHLDLTYFGTEFETQENGILSYDEFACTEDIHEYRLKAMDKENNNVVKEDNWYDHGKPPSPPPRTKNQSVTSCEKIHAEQLNALSDDQSMVKNLPRLVDFVPKSNTIHSYENSIEIMEAFLENEKRVASNNFQRVHDWKMLGKKLDGDIWTEKDYVASYQWNIPSLATIGEEEEGSAETLIQRRQPTSTPIVIVENTDSGKVKTDPDTVATNDSVETSEGVVEGPREAPMPPARTHNTSGLQRSSSAVGMERNAFPSYCRQPPDGHEFPDVAPPAVVTRRNEGVNSEPKVNNTNKRHTIGFTSTTKRSFQSVKEKIAIFSKTEDKSADSISKNKAISRSVMSIDKLESSFNEVPNLSRKLSLNSSDITNSNSTTDKPNDYVQLRSQTRLHSRSQSLSDVSVNTDRWTMLIESRKRGYSKLRGLVIPERVAEADAVSSVIDIPEIKSNNTTPAIDLSLPNPLPTRTHQRIQSTPNLTDWNGGTTNTIPKYSPAFKRKGLQLHTCKKVETDGFAKADVQLLITTTNDAPKSLESITSPTRSDCSFEYKGNGVCAEDDSDNDSAVSSSQSSYVSRTSPPASPTHLHFSEGHSKQCDLTGSQETSKYDNQNRRLLKPQSVEAINRKNILASAKCRSGRDLKVGSPLIQRKFDEEENPDAVDGGKRAEEVKTPQAVTKDSTPSKLFEILSSTKVNGGASKAVLRNARVSSVSDLRKSFEKLAPTLQHKAPVKVVKQEVKTSKQCSSPIKPKVVEKKREPEPKQKKETSDFKIPVGEGTKLVVLKPEIQGGSVGITLAGGTDYETKEITVHKIRIGSVAFKNGQLQKGDRILSINGTNMKGLTHAQSVAVLKEPVEELKIVARTREDAPPDSVSSSRRSSLSAHTPLNSKEKSAVLDGITLEEVILMKDSGGLGFSCEGGHDSPGGDFPLSVKKIFKGGAAEKSNQLKSGDELIFINDVDVRLMSRIDAWTLMKKLPLGKVVLGIRKK